MMKIVKHVLATVIVGICVCFAIYTIWGWLTIQDINVWSAKKGLDSDAVLNLLAQDPIDRIEITSDPNGKGSVDVTAAKLPEMTLNRLNLTVTLAAKDFGFLHVMLLGPFLMMSENVNNVVCCFGVGYMAGLLIVGIEVLRTKKVTHTRLILRPIMGALAGSLLLIIIISGGSIIWNEVAGMNGLSLGLIATAGSLYCEKAKTLLSSGM